MRRIKRPQAINFENGIKDKPTFSPAEMASRNAKLRAHLSADNLDAAVFSSIHNINYFADETVFSKPGWRMRVIMCQSMFSNN